MCKAALLIIEGYKSSLQTAGLPETDDTCNQNDNETKDRQIK